MMSTLLEKKLIFIRVNVRSKITIKTMRVKITKNNQIALVTIIRDSLYKSVKHRVVIKNHNFRI